MVVLDVGDEVGRVGDGAVGGPVVHGRDPTQARERKTQLTVQLPTQSETLSEIHRECWGRGWCSCKTRTSQSAPPPSEKEKAGQSKFGHICRPTHLPEQPAVAGPQVQQSRPVVPRQEGPARQPRRSAGTTGCPNTGLVRLRHKNSIAISHSPLVLSAPVQVSGVEGAADKQRATVCANS
jgi:hypothetical protein